MPDISTILILTHSNRLGLQGYFLALLVKEWEARGIQVMIHHDLDSSVPADVCLVHVDLSLVPPRYIEFARKYPKTINLHRHRYPQEKLQSQSGHARRRL